MFGVGQEGMVLRDFPKEGTLFFSWIYTLSEFYDILGLPIGVATHYKMLQVVGFVAPGCDIFDSTLFFIVRQVLQLIE